MAASTLEPKRCRTFSINRPQSSSSRDSVQLGSLVALGKDGLPVAKGKAGETIDGDPLPVPVKLIASQSPCRVRLVYDSEALAYEAQRQHDTNRSATGDAARRGSLEALSRPRRTRRRSLHVDTPPPRPFPTSPPARP